MKIVRNTFTIIIYHVMLFLGFTLLHPALSSAIEGRSTPWSTAPFYFWSGIFFVFISVYLIYRVKESFSKTLQKFGFSIFIPGALTLFLNFFNAEYLFGSFSISGASIAQTISEHYASTDITVSLGVSAVYLFFGGFLYWTGHKIENAKENVTLWK